MRHLYLLLLGVTLAGAGCINSSGPVAQINQQTGTDCYVSIDISAQPQNKTEYEKATFTYPCAWKNESSATLMKFTVPETNLVLVYPSSHEGDLPMNGVEKPIEIMGQAHVRYIARDSEDAMGDITYELIRGPIVDELGNRPYYQYPTGNPVGDQMAAVFTSLKLDTNEVTIEQPELLEIAGLTFTLPSGWDVLKVEEDLRNGPVASIQVPDPKYTVVIPFGVDLRKAPEGLEDAASPIRETASGAKIYGEGCSPGVCYWIVYKSNAYFAYFGAPKSDEPVPENLDGVWYPSSTVTDEQWLEVIASVR